MSSPRFVTSLLRQTESAEFRQEEHHTDDRYELDQQLEQKKLEEDLEGEHQLGVEWVQGVRQCVWFSRRRLVTVTSSRGSVAVT